MTEAQGGLFTFRTWWPRLLSDLQFAAFGRFTRRLGIEYGSPLALESLPPRVS